MGDVSDGWLVFTNDTNWVKLIKSNIAFKTSTVAYMLVKKYSFIHVS